MRGKLSIVLLTTLAALVAAGCWPTAEQEFKDALPSEGDLKIIMGETDNAEAAPKSECPECCIDDETGAFIDAETYAMTRSATYHVNGTLVAIYIWFNWIVQQPYSEEIDDGYIWGPWDDTDVDPLSRLEYQFVMTKDGDTFDYGLETRLITAGGEWTPLVFGTVTPTDEPHKGAGTMTMDFDVLHALDSAHPSQFHGQVAYDFDVRQVSPSEENPNSVTTTFINFWEEPGWGQDPEPINADYLYERYAALAGKLDFIAYGDITGPGDMPDGLDETFHVESRWTGVGEGRGVATISGPSLDDMNVDSYALTECWAESQYNYYETYDVETLTYTDGTPNEEVTNCGEPSVCPSFD